MTDENAKTRIALELHTALSKLGARSDLLSIVDSYGDTHFTRRTGGTEPSMGRADPRFLLLLPDNGQEDDA